MSHYDELFAQDRAHFMHPSTHAHDHASGALRHINSATQSLMFIVSLP